MTAEGRRRAWTLWALFLAALAVRLVAMAALGTPAEARGLSPWHFGYEPACLGAALERGDGLSDPFGRGTGPSGWLPPVYPALLALCFRLFDGVTPAAATALYVVQSVVTAATAPLVVALGRRLGLGRRAATLAGWGYALHPLAVWYAVNKVWDTGLVTAGLAGFLWLVVALGRTPSALRAAGLGAALGLLLLLNPAPAAVAPAVLLYLAPEWTRRRGTRPASARDIAHEPARESVAESEPARARAARALPRVAAFAGAAVLVCAPWLARNAVVLGAPSLRSNLGVELYVGNNDLADGQHRWEYHPGWTDAETARLRELGEARYSRERGLLALDWIRAHPARFLELTLRRAQIFWLGEFPPWDRRVHEGVSSPEDPKSWIRFGVQSVVALLGVAGTFLLARRSAEWRMLAGALVLFPLPYYVTHVLERYRFPLEPILLLGGAWLVVRALGRGAAARGVPKRKLAALLLLVVCACRPPHEPRDAAPPDFRGTVLHRFDFESHDPGPWTQRKLPRETSLALVPDPLDPTNRVARFELRRDDPLVADGHRSELEIGDVGEIGSGRAWWYGFRTYLPPDWPRDRENEVLAQWKGYRDKDLGEASKSPALALRARRDVLYLTNRWDERPVTPDNESPNETLWTGELEKGVWTDWVVCARWSFEDHGFLRIWRDGIPIVEKHGPNTYDDRAGTYFKIGLYKPAWDDPDRRSDVDLRVVLHDDVWIGVVE